MIAPVIRRAVRGVDDPAVVALFDLWPGHERDSLQWRLDDWHAHLVADVDGAVVGYASVTPDGWEQTFYPETRAMGSNWGYLADLVVSPDRRRRGIGAQLVTAAEGVARSVGARGLAVNPDATGDRVSLHRFYERCGFVPVYPRGDDGPDGWPYFFKRF